MKAVPVPRKRLMRDLFRIEPLEPRILLSADPVLGAAALVIQPREEQAAALFAAYAPQADMVVATTPGQTVLVTNGPARNAQADWLVIDASQLAGGNGTLVIGGPGSNAKILIGEVGGPAVTLHDLVLLNPADGGDVTVLAPLQLTGEMVTVGSGHTLNINNDITLATATVDDQVVVNGVWTLTANATDIQLGSNFSNFQITGDNVDTSPDKLTVRATGVVNIWNTVGGADPLEELRITAGVDGGGDFPDSVSFQRAVTLNGNLIVETGSNATVTFNQLVTLNNGGNLEIRGSGTVVFAAGINLVGGGNALIEGNEIDFTGGASGSVTGTGTLTLRPSSANFAVDFGLSTNSSTVLNLTNSDIAKFSDTFSRIVVGHESSGHAASNAGAVRVGAGASGAALVYVPLEVYGSSVSVEDPSSALDSLVVYGSIKLDAVNDITIKGGMTAYVPQSTAYDNITLWSASGAVIQQNGLTPESPRQDNEPIQANLLTVRAATGITLPWTEVTSLSATNTLSGALSITETATGGDVAIVLMSQASTSANMSLRTTSGSIVVNATGGGVLHAGTGLTELTAAGSSRTITVNKGIASTGGAISLTATSAITTDDGASTDGTVVTQGKANIDITSSSGPILQGGLIESAGGMVTLTAASTITMGAGTMTRSMDASGNTGGVKLKTTVGNVTVAGIEADGSVTIEAGMAIIGLAASNPNIDGETAAVLLAATSGIGTNASNGAIKTRVGTLAASNTGTSNSGIYISEATDLVLAGGTGGYAIDAGGAGGQVAIVAREGSLTVNQAVRSTGTVGHILLQAAETFEGTTANLAVNANVSSDNGSISLWAGDALSMTATAQALGSSAQFVDARAGGDVAMSATAGLAAVNGGNVTVQAGGNAALGSLNAGIGRVVVSAGGDITDAGADDASTQAVNVSATTVRLEAAGAIGAAGALLETAAGTLSARSASGGMFLRESDGVVVGNVTVGAIQHVGADGVVATDAGLADLAYGLDAAGALVLQAGGAVDVARIVEADGNLRLHAGAAMQVQAAVRSTGGHASVLAGGDLNLLGTGSLTAEAAGKTLDVQSTGGNVAMANGSSIQTNAGAIRVQASAIASVTRIDARSDADRSGSLAGQAGWGDVSVQAGAALTGNASSTDTDIHARHLRLEGASIGAFGTELQTEALLLSASATGQDAPLAVLEASGLALGTTDAVTAWRVDLDGADAGTGQTHAALAGVNSNGALVLRTGGALTGDATGSVGSRGNLLVRSATGSNIALAGDVSSSAGHLSVEAGGHLQLDGNVATSGAGKTVDLLAAGSVTLGQGKKVSTANSNVSIDAGGTVTLEEIDAGTGNVRISGTAIVDGDGAGDGELDIQAAGLSLRSTTGGIGAAGAMLETRVATLTANSTAGGVFLHEDDGLTVGPVTANVSRVDALAGQATTAYGEQEDLSGTAVVLTSASGDLTLLAGTAGSHAVTSTTGTVRIEATTGTLSAQGDIAAAGALSLIGASLSLGGASATVFSGTSVDLESTGTGGTLAMAANAAVQSNGGNIRAKALGTATISVLDARSSADRAGNSLTDQATAWGDVAVQAGAIADHAGDTAVNAYARQLRLEAVNGIGAGGESFETEAAILSASAGAGGVFIAERSGLSVGTAAPSTVVRVDADGTNPTGTVGATAQSGINSGGAIVVVAGGALGTTQQVLSSGGGNIRLASGTGEDLAVGTLVRSTAGHITLDAGKDLLLGGNVEMLGVGSRSIVLQAMGAITQAADTWVENGGGGQIVASAGGVVTVEEMRAYGGEIRVSGSAIVDGDAETDFFATRLRLEATHGIGDAGDAVETAVDSLAAVSSAGSVFLLDEDALTVETLATTTANVVNADGSVTATPHAFAGGNSASLRGTDIAVRTTSGALTLASNVSVAAGGNLLLQAGAGSNALTLGTGTTVSSVGSTSLAAAGEVAVSGTVSVTGAGSTLDVRGNSADFKQGSAVTVANGNAAIVVNGTVTVESLNVTNGALRIQGNRLVDGDAIGSDDAQPDIVAGKLAVAVNDYIGLAANAVEINIGSASFNAGSNVFVSEADGLTLEAVDLQVNHVGANGAAVAQATMAGLAGNTGANFVLRSAGTIASLASGGVAATGHVLLDAHASGAGLVTGAAVTTTGGSITLHAAGGLTLGGNVSTTNLGATINNGATVDVYAGGDIAQQQGSTITTNAGRVSVDATGTNTIASINAGNAAVHLKGTSIVDGDADGDAEVDVVGSAILFNATNGSVGSATNAIETTTSLISAAGRLGGSVFIAETDALNIGELSVAINRVPANVSGSSLPASTQVGAQIGVSGADVVVRTANGALTVLSTIGNQVEASGNLLLEAGGTGDLGINGRVRSTGGALSLVAGGAMNLNADVLSTHAHAGGTVDLRAGGAFTQAQTYAVTTAGGNIAVQAGGVATIERLDAGAAGLRVTAASIVDGDGATDDIDLVAAAMRLEATAGGIGAAGAALEINAGTLAARATGGSVLLTETDAVDVGSVAIDVRNVGWSGAAPVQVTADAALAGLGGQNVVLQALNGLLAVTAAADVAATGNLLLSAAGTGADLTLAASVSAAGAMSLTAARNVSIASAVSTSGGAASTIDVLAGAGAGALGMAQGSAISTANAAVVLQAGGDITVERIDAGTGAVRLAGAAVIDGDADGDSEVDIVASHLQIEASGAVGTATNKLETTATRLAVKAGGAIAIAETDALELDATTVTVNHVLATGAVSGTATTTLLSDVESTGQGGISLVAGGDLDLAAGADVRTGGAATVFLRSVGGHVLMQAADPGQSVIATGSGDIRVQANGDIRPGALITTGHAYLDSEAGRILIAGDLQRDGEDIDLMGDDLVITVPVESVGGTLRIGPLTAGTVVVIGGPGRPGVLHVDDTELGLLQTGFAQIVIGSALANQAVEIDGAGNPVVFRDPVVLRATDGGGTISIAGRLQGTTLTVEDTGAGTTLTDATITMSGAVLVQDEVIVDGNSTVIGDGLTFTRSITGTAATDDYLTLIGLGGDIRVDGAVSALEGLTVTDAVDVTFGDDVTVDGDLVIEATGIVTFSGKLTLGNGGQLIVRGGGTVVFHDQADLGSGDATLEIGQLQATGGAGSITGAGALNIRGATAGTAIHLGAGAGTGGLVIGATALEALGNGFSQIRFGAGSGATDGMLTVGTASFTHTDATVVLRGSAVSFVSAHTLAIDSSLVVTAHGNVAIDGNVLAATASAVSVTSRAGSVTMAPGGCIDSEGGSISLSSRDAMTVGVLDARNPGGGAGSVVLTSTNGAIAANMAAGGTNVFAQSLDFAAGAYAGNVLRVAAPIIRVDPGAGLLIRDVAADGRATYSVLQGGTLRTALVTDAPSVRVTDDPATIVTNPGLLADMGLGPVLAPSLFSSSVLSSSAAFAPLAASFGSSFSPASDSTIGVQVRSYLAGSSTVAPDTGLSQRLLADSELSFASGQAAAVDSAVDWWLEAVTL